MDVNSFVSSSSLHFPTLHLSCQLFMSSRRRGTGAALVDAIGALKAPGTIRGAAVVLPLNGVFG